VKQSIIHIALVVRDYDEAIAFFCHKLHFTLTEDSLANRPGAGYSCSWVRMTSGVITVTCARLA
jgi:catechol 2,3-dioxygenase-like lactoylglutathione lyase family enzyme